MSSEADLELKQTLEKFKNITLHEALETELMNRVDSKFFFSSLLLPEVLNRLNTDYRLLEVAKSTISPYKTEYLDTPDLKMYLDHHNQRKHRFKIRYRSYLNTNTTFFEIKERVNTGRTLKKRILVSDMKQDHKKTDFLKSNAPFAAKDLIPSLVVDYDRISLIAADKKERLTIDINVEASNIHSSKKFHNLCILELKQTRLDRSSKVFRIMKDLTIRRNRISKYCLGVTHCYPEIKQNSFKKKNAQIEKIMKTKGLDVFAV